MISYYCNEALLRLPSVVSLVDRSRQYLEIRTEEGLELDLVIARAPLPKNATLKSCVDADLAEQKRSLRGFELVSIADRAYDALVGIEVRMRFIDKHEGPLFHHDFHSVLGASRIGFHGICKVAHAEACDAWMQTALTELTLRA